MTTPFFHRDLLKRLEDEARVGRTPQGLMLCGPQGTGKMVLALEYARGLAAGDPLEHPDVHCVFPVAKDARHGRETCNDYLPLWREMMRDNPYAGLQEWTRRMNAPVNTQPIIYARESDALARKLALKATAPDGRRVVLMWLPERMNESCANKMLKLLEEPPRGTLFLMVSQEPEAVMETVRSRVQRLDVPPIDERLLVAELMARGAEPHRAEQVARKAQGSWTQALRDLMEAADEKEMLEDFAALMRIAWLRQAPRMKAWSEDMAAKTRTRQADFLAYAGRMLRESFVSNVRCVELEYASEAERAFVSRFGPFVNERNILSLAGLTAEAQEHIERNVNPRMVFFDYILKVTVELKK